MIFVLGYSPIQKNNTDRYIWCDHYKTYTADCGSYDRWHLISGGSTSEIQAGHYVRNSAHLNSDKDTITLDHEDRRILFYYLIFFPVLFEWNQIRLA